MRTARFAPWIGLVVSVEVGHWLQASARTALRTREESLPRNSVGGWSPERAGPESCCLYSPSTEPALGAPYMFAHGDISRGSGSEFCSLPSHISQQQCPSILCFVPWLFSTISRSWGADPALHSEGFIPAKQQQHHRVRSRETDRVSKDDP